MKKIGLLLFFAPLFGSYAPPGTPFTKEEKPPNIIIIMADDLGYHDLGCYGNTQIKTPNIDRLASLGMRFTDYHSNGVVCSPTRAALMTGNYQQRSGIESVVSVKNNRNTGLSPDQFTIADYLKTRQYQTGIIGKWHLGYDTLHSPLNNGFDDFRGFTSGNIDYHSHIDGAGIYDWWLDKDTVTEKGYSTDLITRAALGFIEKYQQHPFFLYVAHEAPHFPLQGRMDPPVRGINAQDQEIITSADSLRRYREMIEAMDEGVGLIMQTLKKNKLLENTLVFFCSDNGAIKPGSNFPLNGYKGNVWEGGHRVPAIAYWKDKITPGVTDQTVMSMDIFPTIMDLVNYNTNEQSRLDGHSFLPLLKDPSARMEERPLFWRYGKDKQAVRQGKWKLIHFKKEVYLYDLSSDPGEKNNLQGSFPQTAENLEKQLMSWLQEMSPYPVLTN
ncbi:MAG: sulfatase-like hydrolase/transferase [Terrimonas sp.]|nr:sulfatase-like hydrolase/transferase [Terrimonas sp.]